MMKLENISDTANDQWHFYDQLVINWNLFGAFIENLSFNFMT